MQTFTFFLAIFFASVTFANEGEVVYLTIRDDPSTSMTIMWITDGNRDQTSVEYRKVNQTQWKKQSGTAKSLCGSGVFIHTVDLKDLQPSGQYQFRLSEKGEVHLLQTLPDNLDTPLKIAVGGDAYQSGERFKKMNAQVAGKDPDFVIMAGDIADAEGLSRAFKTRKWKIQRWREFFQMWSEQMVTKEGRMIPIVPVIGNHDLLHGFDNPAKKDVLFYQLFAFPNDGVPFRTLTVGNQLCFYLLDSGHSYPIGGAQAEWLETSLKTHQNAAYKIPVYHIAAYPTETSSSHRGTKDIRKFWCPLFDTHGVQVAMEHDNHTFKRSFPIKDGIISPEGIYYTGDGSWGVDPLKPKRHWYVMKAAATNCYWLLTLDQNTCLFEAFNENGALLDKFEVLAGQ